MLAEVSFRKSIGSALIGPRCLRLNLRSHMTISGTISLETLVSGIILKAFLTMTWVGFQAEQNSQDIVMLVRSVRNRYQLVLESGKD